MNFQCEPILEPIKVIVINPLGPAAQLVIVKMLSGAVFGEYQMVDLCLLVYANEITSAEKLKLEIESCAFSCHNSTEITSDLPRCWPRNQKKKKEGSGFLSQPEPYLSFNDWLKFEGGSYPGEPHGELIIVSNNGKMSISDGDVFCFITNFPNPNIFEDSPNDLEDHFEDLYLIIKIANNLMIPNELVNEFNVNRVDNKSERNKKPIIISDGLVAMDILKSLSTNVPADMFFCPTALTSIATSILGEYLNVDCNNINDVLIWAANDNVFHIEVEKPLVIHDAGGDGSQCDWGMISKDLLDSLNLDHTQFSSSWLKKEFIHKVATSASKNPYGCIYRAAGIAKTLREIWLARSGKDEMKVYSNIGVISDGSMHTLKGYAYVLPLVLSGDGFTISKRFQDDSHVKQEMKRINKEVEKRHDLLIQYCKRVLFDSVINEVSTPSGSGSGSAY